MIAGVVLSDEDGENCFLAFLDDELSVATVTTNEQIVERISNKKPDIIAVNTGFISGPGELMDGEEELKEEGYRFTPVSHEKMKSRRLESLRSALEAELGQESPEIIRFDPHITSRQLAIDSDKALSSLGINPEPIQSAGEFDAVLGAITSRFYQQNQFEDMGVIVPSSLEKESEE